MRIVDIHSPFLDTDRAHPAALLGQGLDKIVLALVAVQWAYYARTVRGAALVEREKEYMEAAAGLALSPARIVFRHLLPNCLPPLIVVATVAGGRCDHAGSDAVVPGLGLPITEPSLGLLIANGYTYMLSGKYWISFFPASPFCSHRQHQPGRRPVARRAQPEAAEMSMDALRIENLQTNFFTRQGVVRAVDDVSFSVAPGKIMGLVANRARASR